MPCRLVRHHLVLLTGLLLAATPALGVFDEDTPEGERPEYRLGAEVADCRGAPCIRIVEGNLSDILPGMQVVLVTDGAFRVVTTGHMDDPVDAEGDAAHRSEEIASGSGEVRFTVPGDATGLAFIAVEGGAEKARLEQELNIYTIQFGGGLPETDADGADKSGPAGDDAEPEMAGKDAPGAALWAVLSGLAALAFVRRR